MNYFHNGEERDIFKQKRSKIMHYSIRQRTGNILIQTELKNIEVNTTSFQGRGYGVEVGYVVRAC